jgi:Alpha-L-arabinofuranosidase B, catalytic
MRRLLTLLFFLLSLTLHLSAQTVVITVPAVDGNGYPVTIGTAYFSWSPFVDDNGRLIQAGQKTVPITGGTLSVSLTASDAAGYVYNVLIMGGKYPTSTQWKVPAAGGVTSISQITKAGAVSNSTGTVGGGVTISALSFSPDDSTIVATWYTDTPSDTHLKCGYNVAVDDGVQINSTFHQAVVAGLSSATTYGCVATSGLTSAPAQNVTTAAAQTRTPITSVSFGSPTTTTVHGDTIYNCISNDGVTYNVMDDGYGWTPANAGANMQVDKITNLSTLAGSTVNLLTNYGPFDSTNGTDGPSGAALSNKASGLFCMAGKLYLYNTRAKYATGGNVVQAQYAGNIIASSDHGLTWNSFQNPQAYSPNGIPPKPLGSYMFATTTYGFCSPVRYAADDGTLGYLTAGNRTDGGNAYVYSYCTDGYWNNGSNLYMMRWPRAKMESLNPGMVQYWTGPSSPTPTDFANSADWSYSATSATAIYSAASQVSASDIIFVPTFNEYLLLTWYNGGNTPVTSNSTWTVLAGPTPAGPWTTLATPNFNPSGYYNPVVLQGTATAVNTTSNAEITVVYSGDYKSGYSTFYYPTYSTITLNPSSNLPLDVTNGVTSLFAGSVARALTVNYTGALINIQRASDNTTTDVGQINGLLNQSTINSFCAGTTCNVKILYDQSGGGHNAMQSTFSNMPVIYTSGAIVTKNGEPSMLWDNTYRYLATSQTISGTSVEATGVASLSSGAQAYAGLLVTSNGTYSGGNGSQTLAFLDRTLSGQQVSGYYSGESSNPTVNITYGTMFTFDSYLITGSTATIKVGGTTNSGSGVQSGTLASTALWIGAGSSSQYWSGYGSEFEVWGTTLTSGQRSSVYSSISTFYGSN